jgi:hypothetical protein
MKQPHRGTMLLIALLMAASLVSTPCAGGAVEPKLPLRVPDYPPGEQYGDPEIPDTSPRLVRYPATWNDFLLALRQATLVRLLPSVPWSSSLTRVVRRAGPECRK